MQGKNLGWIWLVMAGLHGALAVGLGAYAAHGMADADPYSASLMEKATRYQMIHAVALLAVGGLQMVGPAIGCPVRWFALSGAFFALGLILFPGALYAIAMAGLPLAWLAPYGGTSMILGWLGLILAAWSWRRCPTAQ
jgi:uncharacterized membrane protein YgdD (TMEM256/DUF423 family)